MNKKFLFSGGFLLIVTIYSVSYLVTKEVNAWAVSCAILSLFFGIAYIRKGIKG